MMMCSTDMGQSHTDLGVNMASKLARIDARNGTATERRRKDRVPARNEITLQTSQGDSIGAKLLDATIHGCAVSIPCDWTRVGAFVTITLGKSHPIQGIVRWVRDDKTGIEFLWPVSESHLAWHELLDNPLA
jgi:PilZ domain